MRRTGLLTAVVPVAGPPAYAGAFEVASTTEAAPLVFNKPTGTATTNLLLSACTDNLTATWTGPGGSWVGPIGVSGGGALFRLLAGGSEPSTYSFDSNNNSFVSHRGTLALFTGVNQTTPVQASAGAAVAGNGLSPTVTAAVANSLLVCGIINVGTNTTGVTVPSGMTQAFVSTTTAFRAMAYQVVGAGATGTRQWSNAASTSYAWSAILNPA